MKIKEYNKLKEQAEDKYQKAISLAEKERSEELKAIETVWNMVNGDLPKTTKISILPPEQEEKQEPVKNQGTSYGALMAQVKETLAYVPEIFTKNDIVRLLGGDVNENSLAGCMWKLNKQGIIEQIKKGQGRTPSKYKKAVLF